MENTNTRSIQRIYILLLSLCIDLLSKRGLTGRHIHHNTSLLQITVIHEIGSTCNPARIPFSPIVTSRTSLGKLEMIFDSRSESVPNDREHNIGVLSHFLRAGSNNSAFCSEFLTLLRRSVILQIIVTEKRGYNGCFVTMLHHVAAHGLSHDTDTDKSNSCVFRVHYVLEAKSV